MSRSIMEALQADVLLKGSTVLNQIEDLRKSLQYRTDEKVVSFDDHFLFLQENINEIPGIKLLDRVPSGNGHKYENDLLSTLEQIQDQVERWKVKVIRFQGNIMQAKADVDELRAAFESWYYLAALDVLAEADLKRFPAANIKSLATSEFNRLMGRSNLSLDALIEALKIEIKRLDAKHKMARTKFDMGRDQANTALFNTLPETLGLSPAPRFPLLTSSDPGDEEDLLPTFVSRNGHVVAPQPVEKLPDYLEVPEEAPDYPALPENLEEPFRGVLISAPEEVTDTPVGGPIHVVQGTYPVEPSKGFFKTGTPVPVTIVHDPETISIEPRHVEPDPEFSDPNPDYEPEDIPSGTFDQFEEDPFDVSDRELEFQEEAALQFSSPIESDRVLEEHIAFEKKLGDYGEQAPEIVEALVRSNAIDVLVDSVAVLVPNAEGDADIPAARTTAMSSLTDLSDFDLDDFASPVQEVKKQPVIPTPAPTPPAPAKPVEAPAVKTVAPVSSARKPMNFNFDDDDL